MTCKQLGGSCEEVFEAETFDEIAELSRQHGMAHMSDPAHMEAMDKMRELMQDPAAMGKWMDDRRREFDELEEN